jgi:hypothetical protein
MSDVRIESTRITPLLYVDWSAIVAGSLVAFAISSVFLAFGSAIGLSIASFSSVKSASLTALIVAAALWFLWIQISSLLIGGYVAGRLHRNVADANSHEMEIRDGSHGLIVWALSVVLGAIVAGYLAIATAGSASSVGNVDYYIEKMLRGATAATASPTSNPVALKNVVMRNVAAKSIDEADKSFLLTEISAKTGLSPVDAQQRLDQTIQELKSQADSARKYGILTAFLTAASLLVGAVAAWWAAIMGGKHRNNGVDYSHLTGWR